MNEFLITLLILNTIHGIGTWKLYNISGNKSWQSFVPVYNVFILLKIINRPWWWIFIIIIPVLNTIIIPVIWVELSRSFRKNTYTDTFLSICSLGFYNYYINYFTKAEYIENRDINPKSTNGEWTSSIIFAVIAATFVHTYFIQPYTIPTSSLEKSLLVGDFLFVSKFHYGARVPMTPIAAPMVHDSIPFTKGIAGKNPIGKPKNLRSYINKEQLPILAELPYMRLPGFQKIKRNDIVCFNWPVDTLFNMLNPTDKSYYKPIDKKTNYVKRAVGIAGDTLEVINGYVYINGKPNQLPDRAKLQFSYIVQGKSRGFNQKIMINNYDITDRFGPINSDYTYRFKGISDASLEKLKKDTNVQAIIKDTLTKGLRDPSVFPHNMPYNWSREFPYNWNNDFFGPIYIPKKNTSININKDNFPIYKRLIEVYEDNDLRIDGDKIIINGVETDQYTFKQDYYWLMGDNRSNSQDSRSWGFVPFDHVVGKPVFKWLSIDYNAKGFNKIRWDRMFTTVHGEGKPTSYFLHFIVLIIIWNLISYFRRNK
jgi:signal peptidase I